MNNNIIITSFCLFGSFYTFNSTLRLINKSILESKTEPIDLHILNGMTLVISLYSSVYLTTLLITN
jgi:hypothetical protein